MPGIHGDCAKSGRVDGSSRSFRRGDFKHSAHEASHFIDYAERKLNRPLSDEERAAVDSARFESSGKRAGVKAMRIALEVVLARAL